MSSQSYFTSPITRITRRSWLDVPLTKDSSNIVILYVSTRPKFREFVVTINVDFECSTANCRVDVDTHQEGSS